MVKTEQTGLYDATNEHDACGVGMVVNIHGNKSHELVDSALKVLENMRHRGAEGADNKTGDGAGIMLQIPHEFILLQGIPVPEKGKYGTGLVFLPKDEKEQAGILSIMIEEIETRRTYLDAPAQCAHQPRLPGQGRTGHRTGHQTGIYHRSDRCGQPGTHPLHHPQEDRKARAAHGLLHRFAIGKKHYI